MLTEGTGQVGIDVPRDRDGTFEPQIVRKRQRRLGGVDEIVLSLYAKGLATGEISAHFAEIYGASVSKETISRITDRVVEEMQAWQARPLDEVYAAVFIDAIVVKVRDGQVANRPVYAAIGVTLAGEKDILGLWAGTGGEGAKFWMAVLTDLKNRGIKDVFFVVCDGLKGLPDVVTNVWPQAIVQTCIVHYADLLIMPILRGECLVAALRRLEGRHNQRASKKASSWSGGWYWSGWVVAGVVLASAFSLMARSACCGTVRYPNCPNACCRHAQIGRSGRVMRRIGQAASRSQVLRCRESDPGYDHTMRTDELSRPERSTRHVTCSCSQFFRLARWLQRRR